MAVGDPDDVVTFVPGTSSDLDGTASSIKKVDNMISSAGQVAPGATTAGVVWIGYDAPQSLNEARDVGYAERAAGDLDRYQHGLRATHQGPPSHNTIGAHSYGSTVTGVAARDHGLAADSTVFVGSPGGRRRQRPRTRPDPDVAHGNDPTDRDFGARRFGSDPGTPMSEGPTAAHLEYWERYSTSLENFGFIIAGRDELVR